MLEVLKFGEVFQYNDEYYVFLVDNGNDTVYAARILSDYDSMSIKKLLESESRRSNPQTPLSQRPLFSFVELKTKAFHGRAAHLNDAGKDRSNMYFTPCDEDEQLCVEDILALRDEATTGPVAIELKELVKKIDFSEYEIDN